MNKNILGLLVLALVSVVGCKGAIPTRQAGVCKMSVLAETDPLDEQLSQEKSSLRLVNITPPIGSLLSPNSVLEADLEYEVRDFTPGRFTIVVQFSLQEPRRSTDGDFPRTEYPVLVSPAGKVHFCFPLSYVWKQPVEIPFNVRFLLNKWEGEDKKKSIAVAVTEPLQFPSSK